MALKRRMKMPLTYGAARKSDGTSPGMPDQPGVPLERPGPTGADVMLDQPSMPLDQPDAGTPDQPGVHVGSLVFFTAFPRLLHLFFAEPAHVSPALPHPANHPFCNPP